ncbi:MAG TPA: dicarboxylate/amino acid:cation symporter [Stellaceae bacterium]|nr:dicarboxylate/amino acid:cation symporter [Stellaceae bacterium]
MRFPVLWLPRSPYRPQPLSPIEGTPIIASPLKRILRMPLPLQMLLGMLIGLAIGLTLPDFGADLRPVGLAFIAAIRMIVIPIVFTSVTLGIYRMGTEMRDLGRLALICAVYFTLISVFSIVISLVLNGIFHPGAGARLSPTGVMPKGLASSIDWSKFFLDMIPSNIVSAMAEQKVLPTLIFAVIFGAALARSGARGKPVVAVLEGCLDAVFRMTNWIVALSPLAIIGLMAWLFATQGMTTVMALLKLIAVLYLGLFILMAVFWVILLLLGRNPITVTRIILEPLLLAFSTRSSEVTLPLHIELLEASGAPSRIVSVVLPLGYSFNQDGALLYQSLAVAFLAEAYGIDLTWSLMLTILVTIIIANKGAANIPSGGLVTIALVLTAIGLPVEALALIAGVDAFMDMGRTAVNVFGNTVAVAVAERFTALSDSVMADSAMADSAMEDPAMIQPKVS